MMEDFVGFGALGEALQALSREGYRKILVVASAGAWKRFNAPVEREFFRGREVRVFSGFSSNPGFDEILAGVDLARAFQPDLILAIGGGSAMDVAKGVRAFAYSVAPYDPAEPQKLAVSSEGAPAFAAVTTTAGSGAEATPAAVFYVGKRKVSLSHPSLLPQMAVVDPEMTYSLSSSETAVGGFDALAQGVESFWSSAATDESRQFAAAAVRYALPNLYNAVHSPAPGNRYNMIMAAYFSGKGIAVTRTTIPHGLSYHLVTEYGLRHGHAVALTLPYFFRINMELGGDAVRARMGELFALMDVVGGEGAFLFWRNLMKACGLASRLVDVGVDTREKVGALVRSFDVGGCAGHPVKVSGEWLAEYFFANP